ncbi:hypothetical protein H8356DRAFT_1294338 [Neocallimastix lanati (nom. inval.)]|uniref:Scaffoldin n=1 Tax=Neocallimastix californiae TaxID=1754190 RepID=A0A1Y2B3V7_9FUNG|nr:hypothetical protein H8356DRAFT_1294338 [Neocallimastix sp. JGI-2020a]ORY29406.1 hypothetical protein LY90DRAFT_512897 [Neocallimastix californiae]|eukprot:ORY29406.1 hypothetical protein LY90DRAFT_512897 [Neocallimastix californiae]
MFGKNLLKVISALFIGCQLFSMTNAAALTSCNGGLTLTNYDQIGDITTNCVTSNDQLKYCLEGTSIYGYTHVGTNTATCKITAAGTYVLLDEAILKSENTIDAENKGKLTIYQCTGVSSVTCAQTFGYVLNGSQYLEINASGTNDFKAIEGLPTIASLSDGPCTVGLLYNEEDSVVSLCLDGTNYSQGIAIATEKTYVINNIQGNVFTGASSDDPNKDQPIVIKVGGGNSIIATSGYDYCAGENGEVSETFKEFCSHDTNNPCEGSPYECSTSGICTREVQQCNIKNGASPNCDDGYYIVDSSPGQDGVYAVKDTATNTGVLFHCESNTCGPADTGFKAGYYKNKAGGNVPYIRCAAQNDCEAVSISDECNAVGNIISDGGYKICLDIGVSSASLSTVSGDHFISVHTAVKVNGSTSVFSDAKSNNYMKVTIANEHVLVATAVSEDNAPKYIYTDSSYKIYVKADKDSVCNSNTILNEFKLDGDTSDETNSFYSKHAEDQRSTI